jgi:hypothetical protein
MFSPSTSSSYSYEKMSTFPSFRRLPKEIRLRIWFLALPARTIEEVWDNSNLQYEFISIPKKIPSVLQCCSEPRQAVAAVQPFYCSELDTIYVRRQC